MVPRPFRVERRVRETYDTWTLSLAPVQGEQLEVGPGQFTMLYAFGVGEVPISVSGAPLVQTIRAVGSVTRALCASRPGHGRRRARAFRDELAGRASEGERPADRRRRGRPPACAAGAVPRARPPCGLRPGDPPLRRPHAGRHRLPQGDRAVAVPDGPRGRRHRRRRSRRLARQGRGRHHTDSSRAAIDPDSTAAFVVGPEIMMRFTARALVDEGLSAERIWISMERSMKCGVALCGHCQFGPSLICRDGAVYPVPGDRALPGGERAVRKPKLAVWKFSSCDGCQLSLLDCEDELLAVAGRGRHRLLPGGDVAGRSAARTTSPSSRARSPPRTTPSGSARFAASRRR